MSKRRGISKNKLASGPLRGAVASGLAAGLAAASLSGVGTANATCVGISGIDIGDGCTSEFGSFALVLGEGAAEASGFLTGAIATGTNTAAISDGLATLAYAGGTGSAAATNGILNFAAAGLPGNENVFAQAGNTGGDFANLALNFGAAEVIGQSVVGAGGGAFNLAANLFGTANSNTPMIVGASGVGNSAINVTGNRNTVFAAGILNNATSLGNPFRFPMGACPESRGIWATIHGEL